MSPVVCAKSPSIPAKLGLTSVPSPAAGGVQMAPEELALVHSLRKMVRNDWVSVWATCCLSVSEFGDRQFFT